MTKKTRISIIAAILAIAALAAILYALYRAKQASLPDPYGYSVTNRSDDARNEAYDLWLTSLLEEYQGVLVNRAQRMTSYAYTPGQARELEKTASSTAVEYDFSFTTSKASPGSFERWNLSFDGDKYHGQWIVQFQVLVDEARGETTYTAEDIMRPAAYDLMNADSTPPPESYKGSDYKIESGVCSISYNGGQTWIKTPLESQYFQYSEDGRTRYDALQPGSYLITPERTIILFSDHNTPLQMLRTSDMGETWETVVIEAAPEGVDRKFIAFADQNSGLLAVGSERAMGSQRCSIFKTDDGGSIWTFLGDGPGDHPIAFLSYFDTGAAFIGYSRADDAVLDLHHSLDGGGTWAPVTLPIPEDLRPYFTKGSPPRYDGQRYTLLIYEGSTSDYTGPEGSNLQLTSGDGVLWYYVDVLEEEADKNPLLSP